MYKIGVLTSSTRFPSISFEDSIQWRPLSYYVLGGIDLDGVSDLNNNVEYDGDIDETPEVYNSPDVGQPFFDPRISGFDIAEKLGVDSYNAAMDELASPKADSSSEPLSES